MTRRDMMAAMAAGSAPWPFPTTTLHEWVNLKPAGFASAVPAMTFDGTRLEGGVPLGGLGTGYMTLEQREDRVLIHLQRPGSSQARVCRLAGGGVGNAPRTAFSAARINYWGHFPVVDLNAEFSEIPLTAGVRAFSPFIVGDSAVSNTPAALFEMELRNTSERDVALRLWLRFPPAPKGEK